MVRVAFEYFATAVRVSRHGPLSLAILVLGTMLALLPAAIGDAAAQSLAKPAPQQQQRKAASNAIPDPYRLNLLIRTTIIALNQANATGNYSVLRDLAAPRFQIANSHARLADLFAKLRNRNLDLSPILFADPKLTRKPALSREGILRLTGFIPTRPEQLLFDMGFERIGGTWRLTAILVDIRAAPPPPPAPTAAKPPQRMAPQPVAAEPAANRSPPATASNNRRAPRREQKALSATPRTELGAPRTGDPVPLPVAKPRQAKAKSGAKAGKKSAKSVTIEVPWAAEGRKDAVAGQAGLRAAPRAKGADDSSRDAVAKSLGSPF